MTDQERSELERRLAAGEWLTTGDVAKLLALSRKTVDRRVTDGLIGTRPKAGSTWRLCNPVDVQRLLDGSRKETRATGE